MNIIEEQTQKRLWEEERKKHDLKYPDEFVVRFLKKNFITGESYNILDFGCGSGRNIIAMADMGFNIYAIDYNIACLEMTRQKMEKMNYNKVTYIQNKGIEVNLPENFLDCIVVWGTLFAFREEERNLLIKNLYRVLKPGGLFLADYHTIEDSMYKKGKEIEKDVYVLSEEAGDLKNLIYWFCDRETLINLYEKHGFKIINLEKKEFTTNNLSILNSYFHVWAKKEK